MPPLVSGAPVIAVGVALTWPAPTWSSVAAGTVVVLVTTASRALPVGGALAPLLLVLGVELPLSSTNVITTATTATIAPAAISIRFRRCVRCAAARCAAILARRP